MSTRNRWFYGLMALALLLGVVVVGLLIGLTTRACSGEVIHHDLPTWCWEFWLNRYQTLLTGIFALFAAAVAWRGVVEQVKGARLPIIVQEGSKVRALLVEAEEADDTIKTAIAHLVRQCEAQMVQASISEITEVQRDIDRVRKELDDRWTDNDLPDGAAQALYDYSDRTITLGGEVGGIIIANNLMAYGARGGIAQHLEGTNAVATRHEQALSLQKRYNDVSEEFFAKLKAERATIARQRADLFGLTA